MWFLKTFFLLSGISQFKSIPISYLSLTLSSVRLFYFQRLGSYSDKDLPIFNMVLIFPFIVLQNIGILATWTIITAYVRLCIIVCISINMIVVFLALQTFVFRWDRKEKLFDAISTNVSKDKQKSEITKTFWISILTSWISPCSVWINNRSYNKDYKHLRFHSMEGKFNIFI